ncbi:MAG TPA: hypothetical protein PLB02_08525, partial [Thermoanaerobaculia bacterium]|nr:hypothetical protein [Thermoanaerobaculia bacterium]
RARRLGSAALAALLAGGAVRLALAWVAPSNWDLESYAVVVQALSRGDVVYEVTDRYNYSPLWWHVLEAAAGASRAAGVPAFFGFRIVALLGDGLVALGLLLHGRVTATRRRGVARAVLWWTNPLPLAVSAFGGQFDALALGLFVLALALAAKGRSRGATLVPALLVGAGVALKQIVAAFVAGFLGFSRGWRLRLRDAILAAGPFLLLVVPYAVALPGPVLRNVIRYASLYGLWGWYYLMGLAGGELPFPPAFVSYAALLAGAALAYRLVRRGDDGLAASRLAALVFFALTPGFAPQMLLWPLAFAPDRREASPAALYSLFGVVAWADLLRLNAVNPFALLLAWATVLAWTWRLLPRALRPAASRGMNPHGA